MSARHRSQTAVRLAVLALCLVAASGCQSLIRPSEAKRAGSGTAAFAEVRATREEVLRSTYLTWGADEDFEPTFTTKDGGISLDFKTSTPKQAGFAVAIDRDGYLLTAAHLLRKHLYVVGLMDGEIHMRRATPVKTWHNGRHGEEYAVVRVAAVLDRPLSVKPTTVGARLRRSLQPKPRAYRLAS